MSLDLVSLLFFYYIHNVVRKSLIQKISAYNIYYSLFLFFYVWCIDVSLQFLHLWWIPSVMLCNITVLLYLRLLTSLADDFFNIFNWLKWFFNWIFVCEIINVLRKRPFFIWKLYMHIFGNFLTIWSSKPPLLSLTISSTF